MFLIAAAELNPGCTASAEDKSFIEQLAHSLLCSLMPMTSRHKEPAREKDFVFADELCELKHVKFHFECATPALFKPILLFYTKKCS